MSDDDYNVAGPGPSSRNITGRNRRAQRSVVYDADDDDNANLRRNVESKASKRAQRKEIFDSGTDANVLLYIRNFLEQSNDPKKKINSLNCFDTKTPLDMFKIEDIAKSGFQIQDMAIVLDSTQQIYSYRVDRLLVDCRSAQIDMTKGESKPPGESAQPDQGSKKRKKKEPEITETVEQALTKVIESRQRAQDDDEEEEDEDPTDASDDEEIDELEEAEWEEGCNIDEKVAKLAAHRLKKIEKSVIGNTTNPYTSIDGRQIELQNAEIDWLKSNPYFQKATQGTAILGTKVMNSMLSHGITSGDGKIFKLHPRLQDPEADKPIYPAELNSEVVNNMRNVVSNSMSTNPMKIHNNLMLEVVNRPRTGQYHLVRGTFKSSQENEPSTSDNIEMAEPMSDLTVMVPNNAESGPTSSMNDTTVFGSEMPSPSSNFAAFDEPQSQITRSSTTTATMVSTEGTRRLLTDGVYKANEHEALPFDEILMDDNIHDVLPINKPYVIDGLKAILDVKCTMVEEGEDDSKKVWKRGYLAEEWDDLTSDANRDIVPVLSTGIDSFVKSFDFMTNTDVIKMVFHKETLVRMAREEANREYDDDFEGNTKRVDVPNKYYLLKQNDTYKKLYPQDRVDHFIRLEEDEDTDIPIAEAMEEDEGGMDDYFEGAGDDIQFNESLVAPLRLDEDDARRAENVGGEDDFVADAFFGNQDNDDLDTSNPVDTLEQQIEEIAVGPEEVATLTCSVREPEIAIRPEVQAEIQNLGKADNSHWKLANPAAATDEPVGRKKREKRVVKKKIGVDDFLEYFEPTTDIDQVEKVSEMRCQEVRNPQSLQLRDSQIYMDEMSTESKPYVAFEFESLSRSGLMFKKKYGKLRFERIPHKRSKHDDVLVDDLTGTGGNIESDCLHWLLSFDGFRCTFQSEKSAAEANSQQQANIDQDDHYDNDDGGFVGIDDNNDYEGVSMHFDDRDAEPDRYELARQAMALMTDEGNIAKFQKLNNNINFVSRMKRANYRDKDEDDDDDDFDELRFRTVKAKNLDAAKHKKHIADVLNNNMFSMPHIQFALNEIRRQENEKKKAVEAPTNEEMRERSTTPEPGTQNGDEEIALSSVFHYETPEKINIDLDQTIQALREVPDYQENDAQNDEAAVIDPNNPPVERVELQGIHTFQSMALCAPIRIQEWCEPSSLLSFALHLCNENQIYLVQDRSKRNWMTDAIFTKKLDDVPEGFRFGEDDENLKNDPLWQECHDPFASYADDEPEEEIHQREEDQPGPSTQQPGPSRSTPKRPKSRVVAVARRRKHADLSNIEEDEEMHQEDS